MMQNSHSEADNLPRQPQAKQPMPAKERQRQYRARHQLSAVDLAPETRAVLRRLGQKLNLSRDQIVRTALLSLEEGLAQQATANAAALNNNPPSHRYDADATSVSSAQPETQAPEPTNQPPQSPSTGDNKIRRGSYSEGASEIANATFLAPSGPRRRSAKLRAPGALPNVEARGTSSKAHDDVTAPVGAQLSLGL